MVSKAAQEFDEFGRGYYRVDDLDKRDRSGSSDDLNAIDHETRHPTTKLDANLISSECQDGFHRPVLDFDLPARYVESTTKGHGHLYIDVPMEWEKYEKLLIALGEAGILEDGYVKAALRRKATFVRPPWVKKTCKKCPDCQGTGMELDDDCADRTCQTCHGYTTVPLDPPAEETFGPVVTQAQVPTVVEGGASGAPFKDFL